MPQDSYSYRGTSGSSSVVECFLAKEDVAGSTPVSRSKQPHLRYTSHTIQVCGWSANNQGRGTQVVRERSAKPLCVGSIPTRASIISPHLHSIQYVPLESHTWGLCPMGGNRPELASPW